MYVDGSLFVAKAVDGAEGDGRLNLLPSMCNRHGLIAGATGTGKTVTLKTIASSLSDAGVPCFLADVKGDVSGVAVAGTPSDKLTARLAELGVDHMDFHGCPVRLWDVFGQGGNPVRTTVSEMGPVMLSRLLGLTDVQEGVLSIVFHVADDQGLLLLDLKDLRAMVGYVGEHASDYTTSYGNVSTASIGAIQRALLTLEDAGGEHFFGEPSLDMADWLAVDDDGKGILNVLDCTRLVTSPLLYSTFLLWMLSDLYETLPEVGDVDKPKLCFFFDEAHLLFDDAPKALVDKIEQIVKLIRSKGVGIFFITQNPADIPDAVLAQLGNRIQHALRAYTPAEQKAVKAAADSFRANPAFDTGEAICELGTGEALVSFLDQEGRPCVVHRAKVVAPCCSMGALPDADRAYIRGADKLAAKYAQTVDRESAYELLGAKAEAAATASQQALEDKRRAKAADDADKQQAKSAAEADRQRERQEAADRKATERAEAAEAKERAAQERAAKKEEEYRSKQINRMANAALTSMSRSVGTSIARGLMGVLKKGL